MERMLNTMAKLGFVHVFVFVCMMRSAMAAKKVYVVQMKAPVKPTPFNNNGDWFAASLRSVDSNIHQSNFLYTYDKAMQGYAVSLDPKEADALSKQDSVLGVYESREYKLVTTHTPKFLNVVDGLGLGPDPTGKLGSTSNDVIIGLLDSGIWPESKSFNDAGFSDVPPRWKGLCQKAPDFDPLLCNKKLIGAQFFAEAYKAKLGSEATDVLSPRDHMGHGTHTASTAGGSLVTNASYIGLASGNAQGMAPHARIAMYKVCWGAGRCLSPDILAGFDRAIRDGVDILSVSLGGLSEDASYDNDMISMGAFSAMENGITVSASAGNDGPQDSTLSNGSPWMITVGASTIDRDFPGFIELGNKKQFTGSTLYVGPGIDAPTGVVYNKGNSQSNLCLPGSLDAAAVKGKVVICDSGDIAPIAKEEAVKAAGGVGVIIAQLATEGTGASKASPHIIPALSVESRVIDKIMEYVMSDRNPTVRITFGKDRMNVKPAPVVGSFSSRGPDRLSPQILKPDVIAPGVNILAAYPSDQSATNTPLDKRMIEFIIMSGTSMSAPHVSGIVALLKASHPDWGPSTIKSALMTTADALDNTGKPILDSFTNAPATPLVMGAGHINPRAALNPGLVYKITREQYVGFLCSLNYKTTVVQRITRHPIENCLAKLADPGQLNYPSFSVMFGDNKKLLKYSREVTNVGEADSVYDVVVNAPPSVLVEVVPNKLVFNQMGQKQTYEVTFTARGTKDKVDRTYGSVVWKNAKYTVKSPVGFSWL